jgi:hypothetical protein
MRIQPLITVADVEASSRCDLPPGSVRSEVVASMTRASRRVPSSSSRNSTSGPLLASCPDGDNAHSIDTAQPRIAAGARCAPLNPSTLGRAGERRICGSYS